MNTIIIDTHKTRIEKLKWTNYIRKIVKWRLWGLICSREIKALKRLQWIQWIVRFIEQDSSKSFIIEHVNWISIKNIDNVDIRLIKQIEDILNEMVGRWVIDLDFWNKNDWLITDKWEVILIDFAASIFKDDFMLNKFFNVALNLAYASILKYKLSEFWEQSLSEQDKVFLKKYQKIFYLNNQIKKFKSVLRNKFFKK